MHGGLIGGTINVLLAVRSIYLMRHETVIIQSSKFWDNSGGVGISAIRHQNNENKITYQHQNA